MYVTSYLYHILGYSSCQLSVVVCRSCWLFNVLYSVVCILKTVTSHHHLHTSMHSTRCNEIISLLTIKYYLSYIITINQSINQYIFIILSKLLILLLTHNLNYSSYITSLISIIHYSKHYSCTLHLLAWPTYHSNHITLHYITKHHYYNQILYTYLSNTINYLQYNHHLLTSITYSLIIIYLQHNYHLLKTLLIIYYYLLITILILQSYLLHHLHYRATHATSNLTLLLYHLNLQNYSYNHSQNYYTYYITYYTYYTYLTYYYYNL